MLLKLLTLPLAGPIAGIRYCLARVVDVAEHELWDESVVKEELLLLSLRLQEGAIAEEEYVRQEAELMVRLREIRAYKLEQQVGRDGAQQAEVGIGGLDGASINIEVAEGLEWRAPTAQEAEADQRA